MPSASGHKRGKNRIANIYISLFLYDNVVVVRFLVAFRKRFAAMARVCVRIRAAAMFVVYVAHKFSKCREMLVFSFCVLASVQFDCCLRACKVCLVDCVAAVSQVFKTPTVLTLSFKHTRAQSPRHQTILFMMLAAARNY